MKRYLLVLPLLGLCACFATETGNPPFAPSSTTDSGMLDGQLLPDDPMLPNPSSNVAVEGEAGSIDPAEGEVWAWNLSAPVSPSTSPVAADGSFRVLITGFSGQLIRVHAIGVDGAVTSLPLDVAVTAAGLAVPEPARPCFVVEPEVLIVEGPTGAGRLRLTNDCDVAIERGSIRAEAATSYAVDDDEAPLAPGQSVDVRVEATGASAPTVLVVPWVAPEEGLRAVTVFQR